jgi:predicted nucleotidyltransferase
MKGRRRLGTTEKADVKRLLQQFLGQREEIRFACLHGSFLEPSGFRDVDVAVWVDPAGVPEEKALDYAFTLSARLEHWISLPIDVKVLNYASLGFQYAAMQGEPILVRDENEWCDCRERLWRDYWDFAPLAREALLDLLGQPTFPERTR